MNVFAINDFFRENVNFSILRMSCECFVFASRSSLIMLSVFAGRDPLVQSYTLEISHFTG